MPFDEDASEEPDEELGPDVPDPTEDLGPDTPRAPDLSDRDVDPELLKEFWTLVALFNVGLLAFSLGVMLIGFDGRWRFGGGLVVVGLLALVRGLHRYRTRKY